MLRPDSCFPCACWLGPAPFVYAAADEPAKPAEKPAADHGKEAAKPAEPKEELVETQHTVSINGQKLDYTAVAGTILLRDNEDKPTAAIFYIAYTKRDVRDLAHRPVTFSFNGGPGSASVWMHLGCSVPGACSSKKTAVPSRPLQAGG